MKELKKMAFKKHYMTYTKGLATNLEHHEKDFKGNFQERNSIFVLYHSQPGFVWTVFASSQES
jgi:hypothetical protein